MVRTRIAGTWWLAGFGRPVALVALVLTGIAGSASASAPDTLPIQGVVRDHAGNLVQSGSFGMTFRIYTQKDGGEALWTETHPPGDGDCTASPAPPGCVNVASGVFTAILGKDEPLDPSDFAEHDALWLGVSVEGEPEMPRRPLGSSAWALAAQRAEVATSLDCTGCIPESALDFAPSPWDEDDDGNVHRASGRVGIGTADPAAALHVEGEVVVGSSGASCTAERVGAIRYDADKDGFLGCLDNNGDPTWRRLGGGCNVTRLDCEAHLEAGCEDSGTYTIDPDGGGEIAPFEVFCEMSQSGGGWIRLGYAFDETGDTTVGIGSSEKCGTDSGKYFDHLDHDAIHTRTFGSGTHVTEVRYANPATGETYTEAQEAALRDRVDELDASTRLVAVTCDDDSHATNVTDEDPGHDYDASVIPEGGDTDSDRVYTFGGVECSGQEGAWMYTHAQRWRTTPCGSGFVDGNEESPESIPVTVLPDRVDLDWSGSGSGWGAVGFEKAAILVR